MSKITNSIDEIDACWTLISYSGKESWKIDGYYLYKKIYGQDQKWINTQELWKVILRLLVIALYDKKALSGEMVANLGHRLINSEVEVGGPYAKNDIFTNALIAQLFQYLDSPLKNVVDFLSRTINNNKTTHNTYGEVWALSWPNKIIDLNIDLHKNPKSKTLSIRAMQASLNQPIHNTNKLDSIKSRGPNKIELLAKDTIKELDRTIHSTFHSVWDGVIKADKRQEITMISSYFLNSLKKCSLHKSISEKLGVANFYAWMAYTIYDDFIDEEGIPQLLPSANIAHRISLKKYIAVAKNSEEKALIDNYYNSVDLSNNWELVNSRASIHNKDIIIESIPNYKNADLLASRAIGHILGPMLICFKDVSISADQRELVYLGLKHYLIARQLNDDAHDWVEDLENGQINYILAYFMKKVNIKRGTHRLQDLKSNLQDYFWKEGLINTSKLTLKHINKSYYYLNKSDLFIPGSDIYTKILDPIKDIANQSLIIHRNQKQFLSTYSKSIPG